MYRILLVDDDEPFRRMLRLTLNKLGYEVIEAADGSAALRLHAAQPADLVITDLIMPEREGLDIIQELHRHHPTLKIIAISGGGRINAKDFLVIATIFGAHRTFIKPFAIHELAAAMAELLGGGSPPPPATQQ
jgi:DNA-binding response OmpR family regulator